MPKIVRNKSICIDCSMCSSMCPAFFERSDDGIVSLKNAREINGVQELETKEIGCAEDAASLCPVKAITIELAGR